MVLKILPLFVLIFTIVGIYWFIKTDIKDIKARKEATITQASIEKLRCKQRLKGDKSMVVVSFQGKSYPISVNETDCHNYNLDEIINIYYSKTYDKLFLNK